MKTEDLIHLLAAEPAPPPAAPLERRMTAGLCAGLAATLSLFLLAFGTRAGLGAALAQPLVLAKTVLPLALAAVAALLAFRAALPARPAGRAGRAVWAIPAVAAALFGLALVAAAPGERLTLFLGHSIPVCIPAIAILSLPIAAGLLAALRHGAPERPARAGALAGLTAGALAAAVYSTFCTEDSPLFYAVWYSTGILAAAALGALAGARILRW